MNQEPPSDQPDLPVYEPEDDLVYTLEVVTELCGVDSRTIHRYQEQGLINREYNADSLRRIRCIHQVEREYEPGPSALKLILALLDEVESLRGLLRRH